MYKIPLYKPDITLLEKELVNKCLNDGWISSRGEFVSRFEDDFSHYLGCSHAIACCNGTVALHLALLALGIGPGDDVLVPSFTYIASVNAIKYVGANPVFIDINETDWQISVQDLLKKITPQTKAVIAVHLYGGACNLEDLGNICNEHSLFLIEDCAESIGALYRGRHTGTYGDISTFSFFGNKTITTGEGGMVVTQDPRLAALINKYKGQGLSDGQEYWHDVIGFNYRMTNICAALGVAQLTRIKDVCTAKRKLHSRYVAGLKNTPVTFQHHNDYVDPVHWLTVILVESQQKRDELRTILAKHGIETRPTFNPVHMMPPYSSNGSSILDMTQNVAFRGICLPSWPGLDDIEVDMICEIISKNVQ